MTAIGNFTRAATVALALTSANAGEPKESAEKPTGPKPGMFKPQARTYLPFIRQSSPESNPKQAARLKGSIEFKDTPADSFKSFPDNGSRVSPGGVKLKGTIDTTNRTTDDVMQIKFPENTRANQLAKEIYDSVTINDQETGERIKLGTIDTREANALITHLENDFKEGEVAKTTGNKVSKYLKSAKERHTMLLTKFNQGKITADEFYKARTAELELGMGINALYNEEAKPPQTPLARAYRSIETKTPEEAIRRGEPVASSKLKRVY
ncbi:MAG: hypothetical protein HOA17_01995 [Candidatus Melainabacteria bacterium]|jgi:hypothetical protein|nr:hypothetical protein [Candidatus Melainabacteria bacterium]